MSNAALGSDSRASRARRVGPSLTKDLAVYSVILILVWLARQISRMELFKPGDSVGYWLGVSGASTMLLLLSYPLRKHWKRVHRLGRLRVWLVGHMVLGIAGPMLILIHSGFEFGSTNAGVALWSMIIVVLSGIVGRFLYSRVNRGLHGEHANLRSLKQRAGMEQGDAYSRLAFAPDVEAILVDFDRSESARAPGWRSHVWRVVALPLAARLVYFRCRPLLEVPLGKLAVRRGWPEQELREHRRLARKLVFKYLNAVVRVAQFTAYEWMLRAWHVAHIPFVLSLVVSTLVHVYAVHAY